MERCPNYSMDLLHYYKSSGLVSSCVSHYVCDFWLRLYVYRCIVITAASEGAGAHAAAVFRSLQSNTGQRVRPTVAHRATIRGSVASENHGGGVRKNVYPRNPLYLEAVSYRLYGLCIVSQETSYEPVTEPGGASVLKI